MLIVIALQVAALLCLLAAVINARVRISGAKIRRLRRLWSRLLPEALEGKRQAIAPIKRTLRSKADFAAFHDFLDEQLRERHGRSPILLRHLSRSLGFTDRLQRQLRRSRDQLDRAAAAKTLGRLRERVAREAVAALLRSDDPAVVLAAGYASASFRDPRYFLPVLRAVYQHTPITLHGIAELLSGFEEGVCPVIHEVLDKVVDQYELETPSVPFDPEEQVDRVDVAARVVMIDLLAFYKYVPAAASLLRLLELSEHEEVLIHLVKALARTGDAAAVPRLTDLIVHPNWVLRSQAAHALAALDAADVAPRIRTLLDDDNLQVRASAQRALLSLKALEQPAEVFA
jgi:hypothetical protein